MFGNTWTHTQFLVITKNGFYFHLRSFTKTVKLSVIYLLTLMYNGFNIIYFYYKPTEAETHVVQPISLNVLTN